MGFGAVLTRLSAIGADTAAGQAPADLRALVRTQEGVMLAVLGTALLLGVGLAPLLARHWFNAGTLGQPVLQAALQCIFVTTALQVGVSYFGSGLRGLQRQIELNAWSLLFTALRMFGALPFIMAWGWGLLFLLAWQAGVSALQLWVVRARLLRHIGRVQPPGPSRWVWGVVWAQRGYAANVFTVGWLSFLLLQGDRLVLSHYLPLADFAAYSVAASLAAMLLLLSGSLGMAYFPQYASLAAKNQLGELAILYRSSTQLMAALALCAAALIALYPYDLLLLWTHNADVAAKAAPVARALVLGYGINALLSLPYQLQLAHAWTRLSLLQLVVSTPLSFFAVWWLASHGEFAWVPWVWPAVNLGYLLVGIPIMHSRLLRGEQWRWYIYSLLLPATAAALVLAVPRELAWAPHGGRLQQALWLAVLGGCAFVAALAVTAGGRAALRQAWRLV
ncbi:MAG: hypothetical protein KGQ77_11425, partial [Betaproteobacteria bacterium]|nr:hypothetical protein [Betaproteobacteria bacterium]